MTTQLKRIQTAERLAAARRTPKAFIINEHFPGEAGTTRVATLHAASCQTLSSAAPEYKLFASDLESAVAWLVAHKGREGPAWYRCGYCHPVSRATSSPRSAHAPRESLVLNDRWAAGDESRSTLHVSGCPALARASSKYLRVFGGPRLASTWLRTDSTKRNGRPAGIAVQPDACG